MQKIIEMIVEPSKVNVSSTLKLKIKAIRYMSWKELKDNFNYTTAQDYTYKQLKGE